MATGARLQRLLRLASKQSTGINKPLWVAPVRNKLVHVNIWVLSGIVQQQQRCQRHPVTLHVVGASKLREQGPEVWQLDKETRQHGYTGQGPIQISGRKERKEEKEQKQMPRNSNTTIETTTS